MNYFRDVRRQEYPEPEDREGWLRLLTHTDLMVEDRGRTMPSVGALLLFGSRPNRFLPQAGISAAAYPGREEDYNARARQTLHGPLVSLFPSKEVELGTGYSRLPVTFSDDPAATFRKQPPPRESISTAEGP